MNRAERRRLSKKGAKDAIRNYKDSDIERIRQEERDKAVETAMILLLAIPIKVMHDVYGWRMRKRLPELGEYLIDEYQSFADGDMTLQEYEQLVFDYCGMKFQKNLEED